MRWELQTRAPALIRPIHVGNASPADLIWSAGLALVAVIAAAVVIFDAPSPVRPLAVLIFLGFGPGLSIIGLLGISDLTQKLVMGMGVSLAMATIVAGLSIYTGLWSPLGILLVLTAMTLVGAGLQIWTVAKPLPGPIPAPVTYDTNPDQIWAEVSSTGMAAADPIEASHAEMATIAVAGIAPTLPAMANVNGESIILAGSGSTRRPVRLTRTVVLIGFFGGCIMLIALNARRVLQA